MASDAVTDGDAPKKSSKLPLLLGLFLALAGGGGGFYATWSGLILAPPHSEANVDPGPEVPPIPDIEFVEIDPLTVTLSAGPETAHLRFRAQLEVVAQYKEDVERLMPRVVDLLNGYLRAFEPAEIREPAILFKLRSQILHRVELVTGLGRVRDVLIMEFVVN